MLTFQVEKQPIDRLILKEEISTTLFSTSPFDERDEITLLGKITNLNRGGSSFQSKKISDISEINASSPIDIMRHQIANAQKDLYRSPENPYLINNLGLAYLAGGELDKAEEMFRKAVEIKKDFSVAFLNMATVFLNKNNIESALAIYNRLLKTNPKDTRVLINVANIHMAKKNIVDAKKILGNVLDIEPNNIAARNRLAVIDIINGNVSGAIRELRHCIKVESNYPALYNNLGVAYGASGLIKKAVDSFKLALKILPTYSNAVINLARILYQKNEVDKAIEELEEFSRLKEDLGVRELLAELYLKVRQFPKAIGMLKSALLIAQRSNLSNIELGRLTNNLAVVCQLRGDIEAAESSFLSAIEKTENINHTPLMNLIDLYLRMDKLSKAKEWLARFKQIFPNDNISLYYEGIMYYRNEQVDRALETIEEFVETNNTFTPAFTFLSYAYCEYMEDYERAISLINNNKSNFPNDIYILNNLAYAYLMNNNVEGAKIILQTIDNINDNVYLIATRGLLEIKEGNISKGRELYNNAMNFTRNESLRIQIQQKKELELAKYFLSKGQLRDANDSLQKAITIKGGKNLYKDQCRRLLNLISLS